MTTFKLPKKIRVGYQNRDDTYSGKLGYALSMDKRKEMPYGWKNWCDDSMGYDDFDNEPLEGFVLNRDVGGTQRSYGWNARRERVRVYDPRGFEIEITVDNVLLILQECSSIKGKGIEGELVYAWDGKHVGLLPTCSQEYKEANQRLNLRDKKITKKDMVEGCVYLTKKNKRLMYMGRQDYYERVNCYYHGITDVKESIKRISKKKHVFRNMEEQDKNRWGYRPYIVETGFTKLARKISDEPESTYAEYYDDMMKQEEYSQIIGLIHEKKSPRTRDKCYWIPDLIEETIMVNDRYFFCYFRDQSPKHYWSLGRRDSTYDDYKIVSVHEISWDDETGTITAEAVPNYFCGLEIKTFADANDKLVQLKTKRTGGEQYDLFI